MKLFKKFPFYILLFLIISLPFHRWLPSALGIGLLLITWLFTTNFKLAIQKWKENKSVFWFIGFYVLSVISLFFTEDKENGYVLIILYIPIAVLPLILSTMRLTTKQLRLLMFTFINSVFIASIIGVIAYLFAKSSIIMTLFGQTPTVNLYYLTKHPAYISIQLLLAVFLQLHYTFILYKEEPHQKLKLLFGLIKIITFVLILVLMARRLQMLAFVILLPLFLILRGSPENRKRLAGIAAVISILFVVLALLLPFTRNRIEMTVRELKGGSNGEVRSLRLSMWGLGNEIITQNPVFGVGAGDAKNELYKIEESKICTAIANTNDEAIIDEDVAFKQVLINDFYEYELANEYVVLDKSKLKTEVIPGKVYHVSVNIIEWIPNHVILENGGRVVYDSKPVYHPTYIFRATDDELLVTKTAELDTIALQEVISFHKKKDRCAGIATDEEVVPLASIGTYGKALNEQFNFHNQFMQTLVGMGFVGLSVLVIIFFTGFKAAVKQKDPVLLVYMLILMLSFMTESILERALGVLLFSLLIPVFMYLKPSTPEDKSALPDEKSR